MGFASAPRLAEQPPAARDTALSRSSRAEAIPGPISVTASSANATAPCGCSDRSERLGSERERPAGLAEERVQQRSSAICSFSTRRT